MNADWYTGAGGQSSASGRTLSADWDTSRYKNLFELIGEERESLLREQKSLLQSIVKDTFVKSQLQTPVTLNTALKVKTEVIDLSPSTSPTLSHEDDLDDHGDIKTENFGNDVKTFMGNNNILGKPHLSQAASHNQASSVPASIAKACTSSMNMQQASTSLVMSLSSNGHSQDVKPTFKHFDDLSNSNFSLETQNDNPKGTIVFEHVLNPNHNTETRKIPQNEVKVTTKSKKGKLEISGSNVEKKLELIKSVESDIKKMQKSDETKRKHVENMKLKLRELRDMQSVGDPSRNEIAMLRMELLEAKAELSKKDNDISCYRDMLDNVKQEALKLQKESQNFKAKFNTANNAIKKAEAKIKALETEKKKIKNILSNK